MAKVGFLKQFEPDPSITMLDKDENCKFILYLLSLHSKIVNLHLVSYCVESRRSPLPIGTFIC